MTISVKVLYFASVREEVGKREEVLTLNPAEDVKSSSIQNGSGLTLADLRRLLCTLYPAATSTIEHITFACNLEYSNDDVELHDGDEVALIPPISGG